MTAPERIWVDFWDEPYGAWCGDAFSTDSGDVCFIRADLFDAKDAEIVRLRAQVEASGRDQIEARVEAVVRRNFVAPEDTTVEALCLRYGYGAVMDAASRLWARRDLLGAFYIGGCIGFRTEEEARAAFTRKGEPT